MDLIYGVTFQHMPKGSRRPLDEPNASDFETEDNGFFAIPAAGDFVNIISLDGATIAFSGKVISRLFTYFGGDRCWVNIVVADTDDDWGLLVKE